MIVLRFGRYIKCFNGVFQTLCDFLRVIFVCFLVNCIVKAVADTIVVKLVYIFANALSNSVTVCCINVEHWLKTESFVQTIKHIDAVNCTIMRIPALSVDALYVFSELFPVASITSYRCHNLFSDYNVGIVWKRYQ